MVPIDLDLSFIRDGRTLSTWLLDLVSEERSAREAAGEALGGMWRGFPGYSTPMSQVNLGTGEEVMAQQERFAQAVRTAVEEPAFPKADFVRKLCILKIAFKDEWLQTVEKSTMHDPKLEALETRLIEKALTTRDDERAQAVKRYCRLFWAGHERDKKLYASAETSTASGFMCYVVFKALDTAFLSDPSGLWAMLNHEDVSDNALDALVRIGPPANAFAPYLVERFDRTSEKEWLFDGARSLASVGRGDPVVVDALIARLRGPKRGMAAQTLEHMGTDLAGREDEAIALLLQATFESDDLYFTSKALASVGRDREGALHRVLDIARARPPRWEPDPHADDGRYDAAMWERGVAIEALRYFTAFPEQVVPELVTACGDFQEYDPDYQYDGEHVRVCRALEKFGAAAAPIVPFVVTYIEESFARPPIQRDPWPNDAFDLLGAIGHPARSALPLLERIHREVYGDDEELDTCSSLAKAIRRLRAL